MTADEQYYHYLRQRSRLGLWYRRYWLYPRLNKHLRGQTLDVGCGIGLWQGLIARHLTKNFRKNYPINQKK